MKQYYDDNICIIAAGCLLPGANNLSDFWQLIREGSQALGPLNISRNDPLFGHQLAGSVDETAILAAKQKFPTLNRFEAIAFHAFAQCIQKIDLKKYKKNMSIIGAMSPDESINFITKKEETRVHPQTDEVKSFFSQFERNISEKKKATYTSSLFPELARIFNISPHGLFIDAACASSLAAIEIACKRLQNHQEDLIFCGGIDAYLSPLIQDIFEQAKILSHSLPAPFDQSSSGTILSEGSVILALARLEDALSFNENILAIITGYGQASDGKSASLFAPSLDGQLLAYERAYSEIDRSDVDYIEAHGTGTPVGDQCEFDSIKKFWADTPIPIGTIKAQIGHTKGTAGAAGALKAILCLCHNTVPAPLYLKNPLKTIPNHPFIQTENISNITKIAVSSFGFGGTNGHLILEKFIETATIIPQRLSTKPIFIIGHSNVINRNQSKNSIAKDFRIPHHSLSQIDTAQLLALKAAKNAIDHSTINLNLIDTKKVGVISCSAIALEANHQAEIRTRLEQLRKTISHESNIDTLLKEYPIINEDSGPGMLNNVIASRICNHFNFQGKSFNINADALSLPYALEIAKLELIDNHDIIFLIEANQSFDFNSDQATLESISCFLLSTQDFISHNAIRAYYTIEEIEKDENF